MNVFPPSVDFQATIVGTKTTSGSAGWTRTSAASSGRAITRGSALTRDQVSPASSER